MRYKTLSRALGGRKALEARGAIWFMRSKGSPEVTREVSAAEAAASISGNPGMKVRVKLDDSSHTATCRLPGGGCFGYYLRFD